MTALEHYSTICAEVDTRFVGLMPVPGKTLVLWTSLVTGSTYCLPSDEFSVKAVREHTEEMDAKFLFCGKVA